jgi:hypothetical protein
MTEYVRVVYIYTHTSICNEMFVNSLEQLMYALAALTLNKPRTLPAQRTYT